jgi:hypothetical protein
MVDMSAITGFAASVRAAVEITKAMKDLHDANLLQIKTFELTREILAAQSYAMEAVAAQSALLERVRELEEEKSNLEAWNAEKDDYELKTVAAGAFAYLLKPSVQKTEPPHWLCAACYQHNKKSILQFSKQDDRWHIYKCHECNSQIRVPFVVHPGHEKPPQKS